MLTRRNRPLTLLLALALALLAACGGDDSGTSPTTDGATPDTNDAGDGGGDLGDGELAVLSAQEVCDTVTAAIVADTLGLDISGATAADSGSTPQCAYTYETDSGGTSNITIASMDATAVSGRTGQEAFDYVVEINRGVAGGTDFEEVDVDAGDRAIRFTGQALHLGIVAVDGHLQTVIVPRDVEGDAVDALLVAVGDAVGA